MMPALGAIFGFIATLSAVFTYGDPLAAVLFGVLTGVCGYYALREEQDDD